MNCYAVVPGEAGRLGLYSPSTATASRACHKWRRQGLPDQPSDGRLPKKRDSERSRAMKLQGGARYGPVARMGETADRSRYGMPRWPGRRRKREAATHHRITPELSRPAKQVRLE